MKNFRIDNKGSGKIFENKLLEKLTRTHFLVPLLMYYAFAAFSIFYASTNIAIEMWRITYLFPLGWLSFTLVEYLIHRFVFHFNVKNLKEEKIQYTIHGVHHEFPKDKDRLVMPPLVSIFLSISFYGVFRLFFEDYVWLFFAGFLSGYSSYLLIHYAVHRFRPPNNFLKLFWKHHSLHHYASVDTAFSVSFPFWDYLFGTMPSKSKKHELSGNLPDNML